MKFTIDKNLIKLVEKLTLTTYGTTDDYDDETKVWINVKNVEPLIDDLTREVNHSKEELAEYKLYVEDNMTHIPIERMLS